MQNTTTLPCLVSAPIRFVTTPIDVPLTKHKSERRSPQLLTSYDAQDACYCRVPSLKHDQRRWLTIDVTIVTSSVILFCGSAAEGRPDRVNPWIMSLSPFRFSTTVIVRSRGSFSFSDVALFTLKAGRSELATSQMDATQQAIDSRTQPHIDLQV